MVSRRRIGTQELLAEHGPEHHCWARRLPLLALRLRSSWVLQLRFLRTLHLRLFFCLEEASPQHSCLPRLVPSKCINPTDDTGGVFRSREERWGERQGIELWERKKKKGGKQRKSARQLISIQLFLCARPSHMIISSTLKIILLSSKCVEVHNLTQAKRRKKR